MITGASTLDVGSKVASSTLDDCDASPHPASIVSIIGIGKLVFMATSGVKANVVYISLIGTPAQNFRENMAKITISRIFELSRYLATKSGQELKDALIYLSEFAEVSLRNLRNGLTFRENFDSETKIVSLTTGTETAISVEGNRRPSCVLLCRVIDNTYYKVDSFGWKFAADGNVVVTVDFSGSPSATTSISVELLLLF